MKKIEIKCKGSHELSLDELHILQDVDGKFMLKELSQSDFDKLKNRIEEKGFRYPFFFWHDKEEDKNYYLDGTQRDKVLNWMRQRPSEYKLPDKFPACEIHADNKKDAAEEILAQSSNYGKITDEGLYGFIEHFELDFDNFKNDISLPDINLEEFDDAYFKDIQFEDEIKEKEVDENIETENECPKCGYKW